MLEGNDIRKIILTGGAGFIGGHICVELLQRNFDVLILDNLTNSNISVLSRIKEISGRKPSFKRIDIREYDLLKTLFEGFKPDAVIHLAGKKAVAESAVNPIDYYENNVVGSFNVLKTMESTGCKNIIFSSSATVYGESKYLPFDERHPTQPINPYGNTKLIVENMIADWCSSDKTNSAVSLRYFNPVGAHESGKIGENPKDIPNNVMPLIMKALIDEEFTLKIWGSDYNTRDGTGERDYIHVVDLAKAHVKAIQYISGVCGNAIINVGTGVSTTVLELIEQCEKESGKKIKYELSARRPGDVARSFTSTEKSHSLLDWKAEKNCKDIAKDSWRWINKNRP